MQAPKQCHQTRQDHISIRHNRKEGQTDFIVKIQVLGQGIASGGNGLVVRDQDGVIQGAGIPSIGLQW